MLPSSSSLYWVAGTAFAAGIGGLLVFIGLWMEGPPNGEPFANIAAFRRHKAEAKWGWGLLMFGIVLEILTAVWIAVSEGWEARKVARDVASLNPQSQFTSEATAVLELQVRGTNTSDPQMPWVAQIRLQTSNLGTFLWLVADKFDNAQNNPRTYWIPFRLSPMWKLYDFKFVASNLNEVTVIKIEPYFLGWNREILGGSLKVTVNPGVSRTFPIPPQTNFVPMITSMAADGTNWLRQILPFNK